MEIKNSRIIPAALDFLDINLGSLKVSSLKYGAMAAKFWVGTLSSAISFGKLIRSLRIFPTSYNNLRTPPFQVRLLGYFFLFSSIFASYPPGTPAKMFMIQKNTLSTPAGGFFSALTSVIQVGSKF